MKYNKNLNIIEYPSDSGISTVHYIRKHDLADAAMAIGAGTSVSLFTWDGVNYDGMNWLTSGASGGIDKPTETELNDKINELDKSEALKILRIERNEKLSETDWVVIKSNETGVPVSDSWKAYRQALRDLPATASPSLTSTGYLDYTSFTWPTEPS